MQTLLAIIGAAIVGSAQLYADIVTGPNVNPENGHLYYLLSRNSWTGAEEEAQSLGGHLVTINDISENTFVYTTFATYGDVQRVLWIGLFQPSGSPEPAGGWAWVSGEPIGFVNWIDHEPNNNSARGPQNWAMIWPPGVSELVSPYGHAKWNDYWDLPTAVDAPLAGLALGLYGVVEVLPSVPHLSIALDSTAVRLSFNSQTGRFYEIQYRSDLAVGGWANLGTTIAGDGKTITLTDTVLDPRRFYRVVVLP